MKNVLLIGAGRFGRHIAMQLSQLGHQVMAVDTNERMAMLRLSQRSRSATTQCGRVSAFARYRKF